MTWAAILFGALSVACSPDPPPPRPAPPEPAPPAPTQAGAAGSAARPDCGPAVPAEEDNVRAAVLEYLIARAVSDAVQHQVSLGPIVLAQEARQPGGAVFIRDADPVLQERFAGRTPPVGTYSSAFLVQDGRTLRAEAPVAFSTGDICWVNPTRALIDARRLSSNANKAFRGTVEQQDGAWKVTSLEDRR